MLSDKIKILEKILSGDEEDSIRQKIKSILNPYTVIIKNGRKIKGIIVYDDTAKIVLEIVFEEAKGTITLNLDQVEAVEKFSFE